MDARIAAAVLAGVLVSSGAQTDRRRTAADDAPLSAEQIEIYRMVLAEHTQGSADEINVALRTTPLELSDLNRSCARGLQLENPGSALHPLSAAISKENHVVLVDPQAQQRKIAENDPQTLIRRAIDEGAAVGEKELEASVKQAFRTGLVTFTEIAFDKSHRHAVVAYSFVCGGLCGNGRTLLLRKAAGGWRIQKTCGAWIS